MVVDDHNYMGLALAEARRGLETFSAMPIGAVLVSADGAILGEACWNGGNEGLLAHPERLVLDEVDRTIAWAERRTSTLYTTLEPCLMCVGTAMTFFLGRIVFALSSQADGASSVAELWHPPLGHPKGTGSAYSLPTIEGGLRADDSRALIDEWLDRGIQGGKADFARLAVSAPSL